VPVVSTGISGWDKHWEWVSDDTSVQLNFKKIVREVARFVMIRLR